jgi:hypothetical protein
VRFCPAGVSGRHPQGMLINAPPPALVGGNELRNLACSTPHAEPGERLGQLSQLGIPLGAACRRTPVLCTLRWREPERLIDGQIAMHVEISIEPRNHLGDLGAVLASQHRARHTKAVYRR